MPYSFVKYNGHDNKCKFNPNNVGATDIGYVDIESKDENALKQALGEIGPIRYIN